MCFCTLIYFAPYYTKRFTPIDEEESKNKVSDKKEVKYTKEQVERFSTYVFTQKPYLNPLFTLDKLALNISVPSKA